MFGPADDKARYIGGHDERGQTLFPQFRIGYCECDRDLRALAVGNELLRAVQYPHALLENGTRFQIMRLRPRLRFRQAEAADRPSLRHVRNITALLLDTAVF